MSRKISTLLEWPILHHRRTSYVLLLSYERGKSRTPCVFFLFLWSPREDTYRKCNCSSTVLFVNKSIMRSYCKLLWLHVWDLSRARRWDFIFPVLGTRSNKFTSRRFCFASSERFHYKHFFCWIKYKPIPHSFCHQRIHEIENWGPSQIIYKFWYSLTDTADIHYTQFTGWLVEEDLTLALLYMYVS